MAQILRALTIVIFGAMLLSPVLVRSVAPLSGNEQKKRVSLSWDNVSSGAWQQWVEKRLRSQLGIVRALVRSDNQLNLMLFNQLSGNYGAQVILGNHNQLIERAYLQSAQRIVKKQPKRLGQLAQSLFELQELLRERGIAFLLVVSPNKPALYPEIVPRDWKVGTPEGVGSSYAVLRELLLQQKVHFFDGPGFFRARREHSTVPYFAASGTHWNMYASCLASEEMISRLESQLGKPLTHIECDPITWTPKPTRADRDIAHLANLWSIERFLQPQPVPANRARRSPNVFRPKVTFVGSSFLWAPFSFMDRHRVYREREMLYYFRTRSHWPTRLRQSIDKSSMNWERLVFSSQAVVIEVNERVVGKAGFGFVESANKKLRQLRAEKAKQAAVRS